MFIAEFLRGCILFTTIDSEYIIRADMNQSKNYLPKGSHVEQSNDDEKKLFMDRNVTYCTFHFFSAIEETDFQMIATDYFW